MKRTNLATDRTCIYIFAAFYCHSNLSLSNSVKTEKVIRIIETHCATKNKLYKYLWEMFWFCAAACLYFMLNDINILAVVDRKIPNDNRFDCIIFNKR